MEKALIYGRVSTDKQQVDTQEARCNDYIKFKGYTFEDEYYDEDVSGSVPIWERAEGKTLRARLAVGDIQHLIVAKLDRLGRSAINLLETVKWLDSIKVTLHIVDLGGDSLSSQGASGRLMFTVLAGMSEYERELIRSRIKARFEHKRAQNELCGTVPYGWNAIPTGEHTAKGVPIRHMQINPAEQTWIRHMHRLRLSGVGYHRIAKDLNSRNVPTKTGKGTWQAGNVSHVLNNKTVKTWLESHPTEQAA